MKIRYALKIVSVFLVIVALSISLSFIPARESLHAAGNGIKVFIDPGHGGRDPGAARNGLNEKDANIAIAYKLKSKLEAAGFTVIMRRAGDQYHTLDEIVSLANRSGADIFVSIHNNAALSPAAHGTETYWCANGVNGSNQLAGYIQSNLVSQINRANRGVKTANFRVIKYTTIPAVLVECAFVSNPTEAELLKSSAFQDKCATGIFNGIVRFAEGINKNTGDYTDTSGSSSAGFAVIIDEPAPNSTINSSFQISGWAADLINIPPKRLNKVEIYKGIERTTENFLGQAGRFDRPDLGRQDILESGYVLKISLDSLSKGENLLYVYAYDSYGNYTYRPIKINIIKEEASQEPPNEIPVANPGGPYSGLTDEEIIFNGSSSADSDGNVTEYIWDFGDGQTGEGVNPVHTYQETGTFSVTLKVKDDDGAYSSTVLSVAVISTEETGQETEDPPEDTDDGNNQASPVLKTITNTSEVTSYIDVTVDQLVKLFIDRDSPQVERASRLAQLYIDYGKLFDIRADIAWAQMCYSTGFLEFNGNVALEQNNFCAMGTIGDSSGNIFDTEELGVIAHYAHLAWYYYSVHVNEYCNNQYDPRHFGSTHYRYTGDKTLSHLNGRWSSNSTYTTRIIEFANEVVQAGGSEDHIVTADAGEDITANKDQEVIFNASASVVYPISETQDITYEWDWETDGEYDDTSNKAITSYIFNKAGNYTVTLRLTAFDNIESLDSLDVVINDIPNADPGGPYEAEEGEEIIFDGSASSDSDGEIAEYDWDFGDGSTAKGESPAHTYDEAGTYTVTLSVSDDMGAVSEVASLDVDISESADDENVEDKTSEEDANTSPTADPGGPYEAEEGEEIIFDGSASSDSDGEIAEYDWDFGDGSTAKGESPAHTYDEAGTYTVTLSVSDDMGAVSEVASLDVDISESADDENVEEKTSEEETGEDEESMVGETNTYNTGSPGAGFAIIIDYPNRGTVISEDFHISGWAADLLNSTPKKWVKAEIYTDSYRSIDSFLGQAIRFNRPDLGRHDILDSGYMWSVDIDFLSSGNNTLFVYVYDALGRYTFHSVPITVVKENETEEQDSNTEEGSQEDNIQENNEQKNNEQQNPVTESITNSTSVVGYKDASAGQLVSIFTANNPSMVERATRLAPIYIKYGQMFNIRADIAWAQMCHETGFLAYTGDVQPHQNNFAGIGATGGVPGNSFATEELGIIAHYTHLAWYYYPSHINEYCSSQYDPRHFGSSHYRYTGDTTLGFLNGRWAPGSTYTNKIILFANQIFGY